VQPRLPLRFEQVARLEQPAASSDGPDAENSPGALALTKSAPVAPPAPGTAPAPSGRLLTPQDIPPGIGPLQSPIKVTESVRPAPTSSVVVSRDSVAPSFDVTPESGRRPSPRVLVTSRRVPVEITQASANSVQPPPTGFRRGTGAVGQMGDSLKPPDSDGANESSAGPSTIHVHIGRIDVRAITPSAAPPRPAARPAVPRTTLADYLSGRKGGSQP
jgi:hypothetical protein